MNILQPQTANFSVEVVNPLGNCKTISSPVSVLVKPSPVKPVIDQGNYLRGKCPGEVPLRFTVSNAGAGYSYIWYKNGVPYTNTNSSVLEGFLEQAIYKVEAELSGCTTQSDTLGVKFDDAPIKPVIYAYGPTVWFLACNNQSATSYKWYFNGDVLPEASKYLYVANQKLGIYNVSVSNAKGCFTISDSLKIPTGVTGIEDTGPFKGMIIYPNPTSGLFTIELDNQLYGNLMINIVDPSGKVIVSEKDEKTTEHFIKQIDLSGNPKGIYFINTTLDRKSDTRKIVMK